MKLCLSVYSPDTFCHSRLYTLSKKNNKSIVTLCLNPNMQDPSFAVFVAMIKVLVLISTAVSCVLGKFI